MVDETSCNDAFICTAAVERSSEDFLISPPKFKTFLRVSLIVVKTLFNSAAISSVRKLAPEEISFVFCQFFISFKSLLWARWRGKTSAEATAQEIMNTL
ncbi:hypothetical protein BXT86_02065 [candidate division WOR-3 bacterium 4484_100]|uniref:Uncharacterized protein n=1 Tax=candidate division WOR-3 bacterium 4484_100 TaxID=1936077 RepID=A0A1V4QFW5_UNCW3|nr:MAG: hypothetical protein BXT86_02065 [candidate division WOR-3 bacterium 4484_100]